MVNQVWASLGHPARKQTTPVAVCVVEGSFAGQPNGFRGLRFVIVMMAKWQDEIERALLRDWSSPRYPGPYQIYAIGEVLYRSFEPRWPGIFLKNPTQEFTQLPR